MKILLDVNLPPTWVPVLAAHGWGVAHWSEVGAVRAPDAEIFQYARSHGFIIVTQDLDFTRIIALSRFEKPSLVQIRIPNVHPADIGDLVINALKTHSEALETGAILTIELSKTRVRALPFPFGSGL